MDSIRRDDRGFVPLAGAGVLVAVVTLVLAVVGVGVFGAVDNVAAPETEFNVTATGNGVVITAVGPDSVPGSELAVQREHANGTVTVEPWPSDGPVRPADRVKLDPAGPDEKIEVIWEPSGFTREETLASYDSSAESESKPWAGGTTSPTAGG